MDFFLIFFGIGFAMALMLISQYANTKLPKENVNKEVCPLHDWRYNKDDKLQCTKCSQLAGLIKTDNGEY